MYIIVYFVIRRIICLPLELFLPSKVLLYTVFRENPIEFMVSGFQVVCAHIGNE